MRFLEEFGISNNTIEYLEKNCSAYEKQEFEYNADVLYKAIEYLRSIGLTTRTIEKILMSDYHVVLAGDVNLKKAVNKVDKNVLVAALNNNVDYLYYLKDFS